MGEVIDMLLRKRNSREPEKSLPADSLDPFSHALILLGMFGIDFDDFFDYVDHLWPPRWIVRKVRNDQSGEHRRFSRV